MSNVIGNLKICLISEILMNICIIYYCCIYIKFKSVYKVKCEYKKCLTIIITFSTHFISSG